MKKPDIIKVSNKRADQYREELRELEVSHPQDELGRIAFKDGYDFALEDFAVPDMIDALIEAKEHVKTSIAIEKEHCLYPLKQDMELLEKIEQALIKAGCTE